MKRKFTKYPQGYVRASSDYEKNLQGEFYVYESEYNEDTEEYETIVRKGTSDLDSAVDYIYKFLQNGSDVFLISPDYHISELYFDGNQFKGWDEIKNDILDYIKNRNG